MGAFLGTKSNSRVIRAYALTWGTESHNLGGFTEVIEKGAITPEFLKTQNVDCYLNHDENRGMLARSKKGRGTLELSVDNKGLMYWFEAPETPLGEEVYQGVKRGDITESSFCFGALPNSQVWEKRSDGSILRRIKKIDSLSDVSPVFNPAYPGTIVECE